MKVRGYNKPQNLDSLKLNQATAFQTYPSKALHLAALQSRHGVKNQFTPAAILH